MLSGFNYENIAQHSVLLNLGAITTAMPAMLRGFSAFGSLRPFRILCFGYTAYGSFAIGLPELSAVASQLTVASRPRPFSNW